MIKQLQQLHFKMESNTRYSGRYSATTRQRPTPYSRPRLGAIGKQPILSVLDKKNSFSFMNDVLKDIRGNKKVIYESIEKFGIFHMYDDKIVYEKDFFEYPTQSLKNLWKNEGYVYVFQETNHEKHVYIYHVVNSSYVELNYHDTKDMLKDDYFLNKISEWE